MTVVSWKRIILMLLLCANLLNFSCSDVLATTAGRLSGDSTNAETLKLVQVIFRHGDRTPIHTYPNDPYGNAKRYWPQGLGQLTTRGMMQQFLLGEYLRWRYDFTVGRDYRKEDILIQSSNIDRTIMSAQANLAGMYPPTEKNLWNPELKWQPIPVHSIPQQYDNMLDFSKSCPRYEKEMDIVNQSGYVSEIKIKYKWLFDFLTEQTGKSIDTLEEVGHIYDTLFVQMTHNMSLPKFTRTIFPNPLLQLSELHFRTLVLTEEQQKLRGGPLLKELIWHMDLHNMQLGELDEEYLHNNPKYRNSKIFMYSGHDSSISSLLITLGVYNYIIPPYATSLMVELHGSKTHPELDYVKLFYRNDTKAAPYELHVPDCGNPCLLNRLKELKQHLIAEDWEAECNGQSFNTPSLKLPDEESIVPVFLIMSLSLVGIMLLTWKLYRCRRKRIFTIDVSNSKLV